MHMVSWIGITRKQQSVNPRNWLHESASAGASARTDSSLSGRRLGGLPEVKLGQCHNTASLVSSTSAERTLEAKTIRMAGLPHPSRRIRITVSSHDKILLCSSDFGSLSTGAQGTQVSNGFASGGTFATPWKPDSIATLTAEMQRR